MNAQESTSGRVPAEDQAPGGRSAWLPVVGGCVLIVAAVVGLSELALAALGLEARDPVQRTIFAARAVLTSFLLAAWAGVYVARSRERLEAQRSALRRRAAEVEAEARRAERTQGLDAVARALAHEIRAPLHNLSLHGTLLTRLARGLPEEAATKLAPATQVISEEITRLAELADAFMRRGAEHARSLAWASVPIAELARETVASMSIALAEAGVAVDVDIDAPARAWGDALRLREMFGALLRHAIDSLPRGAHVRIRAIAEPPYVIVVFADDGPGFDDPDAVFRPFAASLPLAIVHEVVRAHGGAVRAERAAAGGGVIRIQLPTEEARSCA